MKLETLLNFKVNWLVLKKFGLSPILQRHAALYKSKRLRQNRHCKCWHSISTKFTDLERHWSVL